MQPIRRPTVPDYAILSTIALIWASAFIAIKIAVPETGPLWLAAIRVTIGFCVLLPYAVWRGLVFPNSRRMWLLVVGMALCSIVMPFFLISWAEQEIDAGVAALLMGTGPFLALIGSHLLTDDDRMSLPRFVGVMFGFAGILTIVGPSAVSQLGTRQLSAEAAALGGSLCYVIAGLLIRRIDIPPARLSCLALGIGSVLLLVLALAVDGLPDTPPSSKGLAALIYLGVLPTGIGYIVRFRLIRAIGYATFSLGVNLIPVFGVLLGVVALGEPLAPRVVIALVLVVTGLFISRYQRRAPHAASHSGEKS